MLLSVLFSSSCYWEPIPTETLLQRNLALLAPEGNATHPAPDPYKVRKDIELLVEAVEAYHNTSAALRANFTVSGLYTSKEHHAAARVYYQFVTTGAPLTRMWERCWCDFSPLVYWGDQLFKRWSATDETAALFKSNGFFDPYNELGWEAASLIRHAKELAASRPKPQEPDADASTSLLSEQLPPSITPPPALATEETAQPTATGYRRYVDASVQRARSPVKAFRQWFLGERAAPSDQVAPGLSEKNGTTGTVRDDRGEVVEQHGANDAPSSSVPSSTPHPPDPAGNTEEKTAATPQEPAIPDLPIPFASMWVRLWRRTAHFFSQTYDLTAYGIPVIVDFGWSRS